MRAVRVPLAVALAATGYLHADLYVHGYRSIAVVGPSFLLLASACFALAALELVAVAVPDPVLLRLAAGTLGAGALVGFLLSRTVGLFGFVERGWQPAPQAALSVLAEVAVVVLSVVSTKDSPLWTVLGRR